ncbi:MAG: tRNA (guanosine(37)-N1)-methyltransferase TrmD [Fimbriimonadaceae bacterium]|jgi:tRNA (guanine37-N1)-methyltransferase|nr:tRNA (guanosine(37)-N1)-methyltransferase TrmD [Fimbriimonadaceae bacterium]MCZ8138523.1 tRNA (guanosine(37)-N1)-methyltransferase TrmD [Fimbriimonadaceae bacterium]
MRHTSRVRIDFVTLFPEMIQEALSHSMMARAAGSGAVQFQCANPRDFATDAHRTVDDSPYGGGPGMVLRVDRVADALRSLPGHQEAVVVLTDPRGPRFTQADAEAWSQHGHAIFICGHYEGVDERVRTHLATCTRSIGDFVLTGGELPALMMADAITRLLPGVLGDPESHQDDSFSHDGLLGHALYTRPLDFEGETVPEVLRSGNHPAVARWRRQEQLRVTRDLRPDLFARADLTKSDLDLLP